jgi:two-component system sensor histidine kinase YesM
MQLKMLQAQINPHFLYNTLNLISSLSILEGAESVSEISNKLSLLLRYSLNRPDIVKLNEELSQIENYIYILKIRFPEKINFEIYIDDDVSDFYIPKFIIQPIVENAVKHGLEPRGHGTIRIEVRRAENLTISVEDDGAGIPEDKLNYINKCLACESNYKLDSKIGINNVNFRIKEYYGKEYGINILSDEGNGTKVTIVLPIIKESEGAV